MKKLLVVLSLAMAAFSFQASAATVAWTASPGNVGQQVSPFALFGSVGSLAEGHDASADVWTFSLDGLSRIVIEVSSIPVSSPWLTGVSLNGDAFATVNGGWVFDSVLAAGEYTIELFGLAPRNGGYQLSVETPIPAAVWLFGSALMGLVGAARRKTA
jgi:hypothetical protein